VTTSARLSRRGLIRAGATATAGVGLGAAGGATAHALAEPAARPDPAATTYPFHGAHQAGITTPVQDRLQFASFDVTTESREELVALLQAWTQAAERMTQGAAAGPNGATGGDPQLPPDDTGEALGLPPSGLTLTFGFGPSLFTDSHGRDRFGLARRRPDALRELPHFPGDALDPARSGGDLCVQACADDPQVAFHAVRNLARLGFGTVSMRWTQLGFGRTSSTTTSQRTPRNLFGFKDGTANIKSDDAADLAENVWVGPKDDARAGWLAGGSYLVVRRIGMQMEVWDRQPLTKQEQVIGRSKAEGAPLSGGREHSAPDFSLKGGDGQPLVPASSHVSVVHPDHNGGRRMLRRGYTYVDGANQLGALDAGLFFLAYVRDPQTDFVPVQMRMAKHDALMEYLDVTGSAVFAVPPGAAKGEYVGQSLFA
jgi:deferrochelatase/peroxidase EfeB